MASESEPFITFQTFTLLTSLFVAAYFLLRRNPRQKKYMDQLNGPHNWPIIGICLEFLRPHHELIEMIDNWRKKYGTIFGGWMGFFIPYIYIGDPDVMEKLLSGMNHIDKGKYEYSLLHAWLGTGLLTAARQKWAGRRKLLTPSFHFKILEDFMPIFNEQASIMVDCLKKDNRNDGTSFNIYTYITKCTLDVICETAMGNKIHAQTSTENKKYIDAVNGFCQIVMEKGTKPWLRIPFVYNMSSISTTEKNYLNIMKGFTFNVIQSRKLERQRSGRVSVSQDPSGGVYGKERKAFLDLLLDTQEDEQSLTDADIREEVDTFMFEGHDTTGVNLGWVIILLANNPKCQRLVHEELDAIFADDPNRDVTSTDISKMKYLECCVKEALRLYPSVPFIFRTVDHDIPLADGRTIPAGVTAILAIYFLHRSEKDFPEPLKFKPERFSIDAPKRHPYCYVPFSAGPRNCIGQKFALMEEKVILAKLFRAFHFEAVDDPNHIQILPDVVLRSQSGIHVAAKSRVA